MGKSKSHRSTQQDPVTGVPPLLWGDYVKEKEAAANRREKRRIRKLKGKICKYCKRVHSRDYKGYKLHELLEFLEDPEEMKSFDAKRGMYITKLKAKLGKQEEALGDISEDDESEGKKRKRGDRTYLVQILSCGTPLAIV